MKHSSKIDGRPAFQFYPDDWLSETGLRLCSLAARGLWMDCLCIAFNSPERGVLRKQNGSKVESKELAKMVGASLAETEALLAELSASGVASKTQDGAIYNRRMVRDEHIRQVRSEAGSMGGRPSKQKAKPKAEKTPPSPSPSPSPSPTDKVQPTAETAGAVPVIPKQAPEQPNNGRPLDDRDVPLAPVFKMLCRGSGVPIGVVACEISDGRELSWVLAWLMVTEGDVLKGQQSKAEIKSPGAWFRALCASGKTPPDRYLADAKRKLAEHGEKVLPAEIRGMLQEVGAAWEMGHKRQCPKCKVYYWTDEEHVCATVGAVKEVSHA